MNGYDDCRPYVNHLRIEHSHIDRSLAELQHLLANTAQQKTEKTAPELLARLIHLREQLVHHFREEEGGGCLEEARSRCPGLSKDVRTLETDHAGFLAALDALIAESELLAKQPDCLPSIRRKFSGFLQRLHAHEAEENRILLFGFGSPAMDTLST